MNMPAYTVHHIYEALTEIGVRPESARNVEREFEAALRDSHSHVESSVLDKVMTKADGAKLETAIVHVEQRLKSDITQVELRIKADIGMLKADMHKAMADQTRWFVGSLVAIAGISIAALKLL
jgi:hypothetical protein